MLGKLDRIICWYLFGMLRVYKLKRRVVAIIITCTHFKHINTRASKHPGIQGTKSRQKIAVQSRRGKAQLVDDHRLRFSRGTDEIGDFRLVIHIRPSTLCGFISCHDCSPWSRSSQPRWRCSCPMKADRLRCRCAPAPCTPYHYE